MFPEQCAEFPGLCVYLHESEQVGSPHDSTRWPSGAARSYPGGPESATLLKPLLSLGYHIFSKRRIQLVFTFLNTKKCEDDKFTAFRIIYELFLPVLRLLSVAKWFVYRNNPLRLSKSQADTHLAWTLRSLFLVGELADTLNGKMVLSNKSNKARNRNAEAD